MSYDRKSPKRAPRPDEINLLVSLLDSPRVIQSGPLGRCLKHGWCAWLNPETTPKGHRKGAGPVSITPSGIAAAGLDKHRADR
jgi:hypothetical protein